MSDRKDIFGLKLAIERDAKLSHSAARLGLLVASYVYNHDQLKYQPNEPFPLPWTLCSHLCFKMSKREVYRCLSELHERGFLKHTGVFGCPAKAYFRLPTELFSAPRGAKSGTPSSAKCDTARGAVNAPTRGAMKRSPHKYTLPSEEIVKPMEGIRAGKAGQETTGGNNGGLRPTRLTDSQKASLAAELRQLQKNMKKGLE